MGYVPTRAKPPSPAYPVPAAYPTPRQRPSPMASSFRRVLAALCSPIRTVLSWLVRPSTTWWRPLVHRRWPHHNMDYRTHALLWSFALSPCFQQTDALGKNGIDIQASDSCLRATPSLSNPSAERRLHLMMMMMTDRLHTRYFTTSTSRTPHIVKPPLRRQTLRSWSSGEFSRTASPFEYRCPDN